jgi:hypothetical protein
MTDADVVAAFVSHLRTHGHPGLKIERRPDQENRGSPDIDAIAGTFAIEHTSVDTLPNQRRDSSWFMRVIGDLEAELGSLLPFRLSVTIEYAAVTLGQDWSAVRDALRRWIVVEAPTLADGRAVIDVPGVPFRLHVSKATQRAPGLFFARLEPEDDTLARRVRAAADRKAEKLAPYRAAGMTAILLIENGDIALMNDSKMLDAIRAAYPDGLPAAIDLIWYADTSVPGSARFRDFTSEFPARR